MTKPEFLELLKENTGIPGFSLIAGSSRKADVTPGQLDPRFSIQVAPILWSFIVL